MSQERFLQLLSRKLANEATIQEHEELDKLLTANPEWKELAYLLTTETSSGSSKDNREAEAAYAAHLVKMELIGRLDGRVVSVSGQQPALSLSTEKNAGKLTIRRIKVFTRIAAAFILVLGSLWLYRLLIKDRSGLVATNEIVTHRGNRSSVKLPDGTQVWLNSDSKLTYSDDFGKMNREVKLSGEAYFEVIHDSKKPFIIHTDKINVTDLGTTFNVKAYPKDETVETSLIKGSIEVTFNDRPSEKIILKPSEKLVIKNNQADIVTTAGNPPSKIQLNSINVMEDKTVVETAWVHDKIVFSNETLENITHMLERRFDVEFVFKDNSLKDATYTGIFEKEPLQKILEYMSLSKPFNYTIKGGKIMIGE
jgi:ferric-dicitrate binding protein FerR (iron transport regulator)